MLERGDQRDVWAEVDRYANQAAAPSPTRSYQAIHDKPEVQAYQKDMDGTLGRSTAPGAHGAAVFAGDVLVGLDLFQDPSLFAREWSKLLRAQALETYGRSVDGKTDERRLRAYVSDLVRAAAATGGAVRRGVGVGRLVEFRANRFRGSALVAEGQVVHAAVL